MERRGKRVGRRGHDNEERDRDRTGFVYLQHIIERAKISLLPWCVVSLQIELCTYAMFQVNKI